MKNKYKKIIDDSAIVSFDIYDTLVARKVCKPEDVFEEVERIYNKQHNTDKIIGFKKNRIIAETNCRKRYEREITLDEIYDELKKTLGDKARELKKIEVTLEVEISVPICKNISLFKYAIENGKKVFIISDMYLPKDTLEKILDKCRISGYEKLYVSSDTKMKKSNGAIYAELRKKFKKELWVHFGDNIKSDCIMAKKNNITAVHISNLKSDGDLRIYEEDLAKNFGYNILGPVCYGYANWLNDNIKKENIKKIFFFSREGFFLKKIFDIVIEDEKIERKYLYVSRKSLITPILASNIFFSNLEKFRNIGNKSAGEYLKSLGLSEQDVKRALQLLNIEFSDPGKMVVENKEKIKDLIEKKDEFEIVLKYLENNDCSGKFAVVDIGWTGTMQIALSEILRLGNISHDVYGYFLGQRPEMKHFLFYKFKNKGYLCDYNNNKKIQNELLSCNCLFELLCMAPHGTCDGYEYDMKGEIIPVLKENEYGEQYNTINTIQEYAYLYLIDRKKYYPEVRTAKEEFNRFRMFLRKPSKEYAEFFGDMNFYDSSLRKIARKRSKGDSQSFIKAYYNSYWKVGFLRRNIVITIPYLLIYRFTRWIGGLLQ